MCNFHCLYLPASHLKNSDNTVSGPVIFFRQDYTESVEAIGRALKELKAKSKVPRALVERAGNFRYPPEV